MTNRNDSLIATYYHDADFWLLERKRNGQQIITVDGSFRRETIVQIAAAAGMRLEQHPKAPRALVINSLVNPLKYGYYRQWVITCAETGKLLKEVPAGLDDTYYEREKAVDWANNEGYTVIQSWHGGHSGRPSTTHLQRQGNSND